MLLEHEKDAWMHPEGRSLIRPEAGGLSEEDLQKILKVLSLAPFDGQRAELPKLRDDERHGEDQPGGE